VACAVHLKNPVLGFLALLLVYGLVAIAIALGAMGVLGAVTLIRGLKHGEIAQAFRSG